MRIDPGILYGNPQIPGIGVFEDVGSTSGQDLDWPSKSEGRWMDKSEFQKTIKQKGIPDSAVFNCTLSSYSAGTLEDIVAELIVDTADGERRTFPVTFDPLISGRSFSFYMVNVCSYGVTPTVVQWADSAKVRVLGEKEERSVPFRFQKRSWPSELMPPSGASSFLWNGMQSCKWDRSN